MTETNQTPSWIQDSLFENVIKKIVPEFKEIKTFKLTNALLPGENYATIMLRIQLDVDLKDNTAHTETLMMKIPHDTEVYRKEMAKWDMFTIESLMYREIIPELEQLYLHSGLTIQLCPTSYLLATDKEYILLEDLKKRGYRNTKRQDGLDMEHCKKVLEKIAQLHAASAVRVERKGPYPKQYVKGIANDVGFETIRTLMDSCVKNALKVAKSFPNHEMYYEEMQNMGKQFTEVLFETSAYDDTDFNVLNHGDCWSNNIMFKYDTEGHLLDCCLVDLQTPRYGNAAQDLNYFILTSAKLELKINHFDEMIRYYHQQLRDHLKLLKYSKPIPTLGDIHRMILKAGAWSIFAALNVLPIVLADSSQDATVDNLIGDSEESEKFKERLYANERTRKHYEVLLPWLYHRGAFDCN
ncbi:uncharacterized protein LOC106087274 [Stomoxys calcitrans]|uniref:uncharacterized protein LOC106087274 n=1 Tax=Stomoxys calcitrans TaxID=35570 RepID=UPI0027E2410D|nr:uncharacterized protein LOC106087274 [Stomoxys calcitrans]